MMRRGSGAAGLDEEEDDLPLSMLRARRAGSRAAQSDDSEGESDLPLSSLQLLQHAKCGTTDIKESFGRMEASTKRMKSEAVKLKGQLSERPKKKPDSRAAVRVKTAGREASRCQDTTAEDGDQAGCDEGIDLAKKQALDPGPEDRPGWVQVPDPRSATGEKIWSAPSKNAVESLGLVLVTERAVGANRYLCTKCHHLFWGSKVKIINHFIQNSSNPGSNKRAQRLCSGKLSQHEAQALRSAMPCAHDAGEGSEAKAAAAETGDASVSEANMLTRVSTDIQLGDRVDVKRDETQLRGIPVPAGSTWFPGMVVGVRGKGRNAKYAVRCDNGQEDADVPGSSIRRSTDLDWAKDLELCKMAEGDAVLARWQHPFGGRKWYPGTIASVKKDADGRVVYAIQYVDGMAEKDVRRENIKGKERPASSAPLVVWNSLGTASYSKPSEASMQGQGPQERPKNGSACSDTSGRQKDKDRGSGRIGSMKREDFNAPQTKRLLEVYEMREDKRPNMQALASELYCLEGGREVDMSDVAMWMKNKRNRVKQQGPKADRVKSTAVPEAAPAVQADRKRKRKEEKRTDNASMGAEYSEVDADDQASLAGDMAKKNAPEQAPLTQRSALPQKTECVAKLSSVHSDGDKGSERSKCSKDVVKDDPKQPSKLLKRDAISSKRDAVTSSIVPAAASVKAPAQPTKPRALPMPLPLPPAPKASPEPSPSSSPAPLAKPIAVPRVSGAALETGEQETW